MQKPKNVETRTFGSFSIDLPKDWQLVAGHGGTLFTVAERAKGTYGRTLVLEYMRLQAAFDPSIVEAVARVELRDLQAGEPASTAFTQVIYRQDAKFVIITQYDRPDLLGGKDHVVQYTIPAGTTLYRLVGITPLDQIDKAKEVFAHVAASLRPMYDRDPRSGVHPGEDDRHPAVAATSHIEVWRSAPHGDAPPHRGVAAAFRRNDS